MARPRLIDPVEGEAKEKELEQEMESFDLSKIKATPIPQEAARVSKPFDGYPLKYAGKGKDKICLTHLVGYNHIAKPLRQDPSNKSKKNGDGKVVKILTYHNRFIRNTTTKDNEDVVFDRKIALADGEFYFAVIPNPYVRAQVCFRYETKKGQSVGSIKVDERYLLLDMDQKNRLKQCFEHVINPLIAIERDAEYISGETKTAPGSFQEEADVAEM